MADVFPGFPRGLIDFLKDLNANNDRKWFADHKSEYESMLMDPAKDFVSAIGPALLAFNPDLRAEPKLNGSIRRLHRDVRFAKDKRPFSPQMHLVFWQGAHPNRSPAFHMVIDHNHFGFGAGHWGFSSEQLEHYRLALTEPACAERLAKSVDHLSDAGEGDLDPPALKRMPKGFDVAESYAPFALHKGIIVRSNREIPDALFKPQAVGYVADRIKAYAPLHNWLVENVYAEEK